MTDKAYDLVVIGAGNGGQAAAGVARAAGQSVAIVESHQVGGVCPNRGCVPKKVLVAAAETLDLIQRASAHHISVADVKLDWGKLIERKRELIAGMPEGMEGSLKRREIDVFKGVARFSGPSSAIVSGSDGETTLRAKKFVVATGSVPRKLPIEGAEYLITSDEFLELDELPKSIVFVGAGVVAMEFAHVLARAGSQVTLLEVGERPLAAFDADAVGALVDYTRSLGVELKTGAVCKEITRVDAGLRVSYEHQGETHEVVTSVAMNGAGRVANLARLALDRAGITVERGAVRLKPTLESEENPNVHFCGDALVGVPQLSPVATYEGKIVGHNLIHPEALKTPDYSVLPSAVYTIPSLAMVGLTQAQAEAQGLKFEAKVNDPKAWLSGRTYNEQATFAKVLVDSDSDQILGAHFLGHGSNESIHVIAMAMRTKMTATELRSSFYAYPTFTNDLKFLV